jgi:hypothetical protein
MRRYGGIAILVVCAAFLGLLKLFETNLTYPLDPTPVSPGQAGVVMDVVTMTGADGAQIVLWHAAPAAGQPLILYFPGNAGNLGNRAVIPAPTQRAVRVYVDCDLAATWCVRCAGLFRHNDFTHVVVSYPIKSKTALSLILSW